MSVEQKTRHNEEQIAWHRKLNELYSCIRLTQSYYFNMYGSISSFLSPPLEINNSSRCTFLFNTKESIFANNTHISDIEEKGNKKLNSV